MSRTIHVVPHTHWDREWYRPFQTFRLRLVEVVDRLLDLMEREPELAFTLDGQMATVDDYLEARPEATERIRKLVASGRLAVGPWRILMDEFLVSGETIVRNLEMGLARGAELGAVMRIGYLPDMFGHIAQMPQLLARAGIDRGVVWRGVPCRVESHVFTWEAPDGSSVAAEYLVGGYGNAAHLFAVPARTKDKVEAFRTTMEPFFHEDDDLLAMHGTDHMGPLPELVDLVRDYNGDRCEAVLRISTLTDYLDAARRPGDGDAHCIGELRSGARANMLMGVTSARMPLRIAAARAERSLARWAEPLTALHGEDDSAALLELAWSRVVDNSAHDSICGCSTDEVARQVAVRYDEARQIGEGLARRVMERVAAGAGRDGIAVLNPSPFVRSEVVELDLPVPLGWNDVALSSDDGGRAPTQELQTTAPVIHRARMQGRDVPSILDLAHGRELLGREVNGYRTDEVEGVPRLILDVDAVADPPVLDMDALRAEIETAAHARDDENWEVVVSGRARRRLLAHLEAPALGWATARLLEGSAETPSPVRVAERTLDNGLVRITIDDRGEVTLEAGGLTIAGVGRLVDGGDAGDSYNYAPPTPDHLVSDPDRVEIATLAAGPLKGALEIVRSYAWPASADPQGRSRDRRQVDVTSSVELRVGEPFARVRVAFDNPCADHRVRYHIPLPAPVASSFAEGQFAVVERGLEVEGGHGEHPLPTMPALGMVAVDGLSVLLRHVVEYELVDGGRELALTLLRSIGMISRNDNALRREPAGPEVAIPEAQCLGAIEIEFGLYPQRGSWQETGALVHQECFAHPFAVAPGTADPTPASLRRDGLHLSGPNVALTALRRKGDGIEVRLACEQSEPATARLRGDFLWAVRTDLLGQDLESLEVHESSVELTLAPWEIATLRLSQ